jgi:outer membrane protein assembly factor BamB
LRVSLKQVIAIVTICLLFLPTLGVISESNQKEYIFDQHRFICTDGYGFNEAMYKQMVQMDKSNEVSFQEEPEINTSPDVIDTGLMDSAWPMKCHDNKHTGRSLYSTIDNNGAELWKFKADGWIESGPVISSDGTIYLGDYWSVFYALNPDGTLKWKFDEQTERISSSPALDSDGSIYFGCWDKYLYALNTDGNLKWKTYTDGTVYSSPAIADDGTIYVGTMVGFDSGDIVAISPDGTIKWKYETGYYITSDPAIGDDGTIYIGSGDTYLYAMNPDGTLKWRFKTEHYIKGPPSIAEDGTIYIGSYDDYLYAIYPDGTLKWKFKVGYGTETNPSIGSDGTIYVGGSHLWAINPDGTLKWMFTLGEDEDIFQSSPAISADGITYVGTNIGDTSGGNIIAVNPDGTLRWERRIVNVGWVDSSPCIDANGIVYIGSSINDIGNFYGNLYAFGHGENVNNPPNTPAITGPNSGKTGETYTYTFSATDPDDDQLYYYVNWGDSTTSDWQGPYQSGSSITLSHSWSDDGTYSIKAKAKDDKGSESTYATLQVTMPKSKTFSLLDRLIEGWSFFRFFN